MALILTVLSSIISLVVGLFVYLKNPKSNSNALFSFFTFILGFWIIADFLPLTSLDEDFVTFWLRVNMFLAVWLCFGFFLFVYTFPKAHIVFPLKLFAPASFLVLTVSLLSLFPYVFEKVRVVEGAVVPSPGPAMPLFALNVVFFLVGGLLLLIKKYRLAKRVERAQLRFVLLGTLLMFSLIFINNFLAVVLLKNTSLVVLSPLYILIFVFFVAYAMVRHRFMDLHLIVARTVSFSLLTALLAAFYVIGFRALLNLFGAFLPQNGQVWFQVALTVFVALSFQTFKRLVEKVTDPIFFKEHFEGQLLLSTVSRTLPTTIILKELSDSLLATVRELMSVRGTAILLVDRKSRVSEVFYEGFSDEFRKISGEAGLFFRQEALLSGEYLSLDEIEEGSLKELLRLYNVSLVFPLVVKGEIIGLFILGNKESGDIYSAEEVNVLKILMPEIALGIANARSYEEILKFNMTLKEEVKRATHKLKVANDKLKVLDRLKDEFVSVASHELRTPMGTIKSYLWMALAGRGGTLSQKTKGYIERAFNASNRLISLVNDMLNVSRIEGGRIELNEENLDLASFTAEVASEMKPKADEKSVYLKITPAPALKVFADKNKVREVLINLIGNSLKFTVKGGITIECRAKNPGLAEVSVYDTGPGIEKEDQERLFKKFGRLENSYISVATNGGTGLGLYITKQLVELMGGEVGVESKIGEGSRFWFTLPLESKGNFELVKKTGRKFTRKATA